MNSSGRNKARWRRTPRGRNETCLSSGTSVLPTMGPIKHSFPRRIHGLAQRRRQPVQRPIAEHAAQSALTTPVAARLNRHLARDVVLVIVNVQAQRAPDVVLNQLAQTPFAMQHALRGAQDVVAVGKQAGRVGGRVGGHVEHVPDVGDDGDGRPLEGQAEGGAVGGDGDVDGSCSLALF